MTIVCHVVELAAGSTLQHATKACQYLMVQQLIMLPQWRLPGRGLAAGLAAGSRER